MRTMPLDWWNSWYDYHERACAASSVARPVLFVFNGVTMVYRGPCEKDLAWREYWRAISGKRDKHVDTSRIPATLSAGCCAKDAKKDRAYAKRENARLRTERKKLAANKATFERIAVPKATWRDSERWQQYRVKNTDEYGNATLDYAERAARLAEGYMERGSTFKQAWAASESVADFDGISGFMASMARTVLAQCWEFGTALGGAK